jgi:hypothetical protein
MDLGSADSIAQAFAHIEKDYGRCDVLVNNAGVARTYSFLDYPLDNWLQTMNVNVTGVLLAGQHAARLMVKQGWGRIVNISSISGIRAGAGRTAYGTLEGGGHRSHAPDGHRAGAVRHHRQQRRTRSGRYAHDPGHAFGTDARELLPPGPDAPLWHHR